jgi:serine/threonine protein kinase
VPPIPEPLPSGFVLGDRFDIIRTLGRGGFGIVYLAKDRRLHDETVIKELAPEGTERSEDGVLALESLGAHQAHHLRQRFLEEAKLLGKLHSPGLPTVRAAFGENGTAYYAIEHIDGAVTLDKLLGHGHKFDADGAMDMFYQLLEILEALHAKNFLHRDIKPSNILVAPSGAVTLIDFGAAREWHADSMTDHTVLFTPGYAPLEQLSPRGRRGPATDIYALCATGYHLLTGAPPPDAAERADGVALTPIRTLRPLVDSSVAAAIEHGLALRYEDRPQTMHELRQLLTELPREATQTTLAEMDDLLVQLKRFTFDRRACPSCGGVLEEARPLKKQSCPVCRKGHVRGRNLNNRLCPACRSAILIRVDNTKPLHFCPCCKTGELTRKRVSFLASKQSFTCGECEAKFESVPEGMVLTSAPNPSPTEVGTNLPVEEWREMSGRSSEVFKCDGCHAQFDTLADGRRKQVVPEESTRALYPEEWARVAARLEPSAGNAECDHCGAEFDVDGETLSLISAHEDPYDFAKRYAGRLLTWEDVRWLGIGKESPTPGLVCYDCGTEYDHDGEYLRLVRTENPKLIRHVDEPKTAEDWHRVAKGLPEVHEEKEFMEHMDDSVAHAFVAGEIGVDSSGQLIWSGSATRIDDTSQTGNLIVRQSEITFGGMIRKWRSPLDAVITANADGHTLLLTIAGAREPMEFDIEPIELTAALKSGKRTVLLGAGELAERIELEARAAKDR